jgi:starch-binding outer membrane protein, SusD/RagB family
MKKLLITIFILSLSISWSCNDEEFLTKQPNDNLSDAQVWANRDLVVLVLADLYNRFPDYQTIERWWDFTNFDEAFASRGGDYWRHQNSEWGYGEWGYWDYNFIRALNVFIKRCAAADKLSAEDREVFLSEARFLRAAVYFEEAKRMGGVPLILEPLSYDYSGEPDYLQFPRAKEHEIYDFVISELDDIKDKLYAPTINGTRIYSRATRGVALAMKARAALYAASVAKYGVHTPTEFLPGGEAGIPASMAQGYYGKALAAAQELIGKNWYSLYQKNTNLRDNFSNLFLDKSDNPEVIFANDFKLKDRPHGFTTNNQPIDQTEEPGDSGFLNPTLNLVQSFEKLDNTFAPLDIGTPGNYVYYDHITDLYEGRDARLWGTVMLPGTQFKGRTVDIWAGYILSNNSTITSGTLGGKAVLPGQTVSQQVVGLNGPIDQVEKSAQTGYYIRKYLDPTIGSGQRGIGSSVWWIRYRYAEVLLNAAEAAFEQGQPGVAAGYMNEVRKRAGFTIDLTAGDITFDRIVHERKAELAFEGHQLWDMKRWRLAHVVWNGELTDLTANPGKADEPSTRPFGLWPYRVYDPGNPNDGKWVFKKIVPGKATTADKFRMKNYYSEISSDILSHNPKLVQNP